MIWWRNKISSSTMNLAAGEMVTEIEVFEICLAAPGLDESVLRQIDREIPYHILFLLEYEGKYQAWMAYKETAENGSASFKVRDYYHTCWMEEAALPLMLDGLDIDKVYENFVRQIAGEFLSGVNETLNESVEQAARKKVLEKQISALQGKIRREKQFNRQVEMNTELKNLKKELTSIK